MFLAKFPLSHDDVKIIKRRDFTNLTKFSYKMMINVYKENQMNILIFYYI